MCVIAERPVYINNFRKGGHIHEWNRWLTSDDKTDDCNTILRITAVALLALTVIGFLFAFAVCALMDWYEERQAIVAFNEEIKNAFGTSDPLTILSRLQSEKDTLEPSILELGLHAILPVSSISFKEKFTLAKEAEQIFETKNYKEQRELFIPIIVCKESVEVPLSLLETSSIIRDMQLLDDENEPYFEETPTLIETRHFSLQDFKNYLPLISKKAAFSFNDLSSWLKTISIAHYLDCDNKMMKKLAKACPHFDTITIVRGHNPDKGNPITCKEVTINHIRKILECNLEAETIAEVVAPLVADYILVEYTENYSGISEVLLKLTSLPGFIELAKYLPIDLNLKPVNIDQENLDALIALFPRVKGLNIKSQDNTLTIPTHIIPNLRKLKLSGHFSIIWPNVASLPRLETLQLDHNPGFNIPCPNLKQASMTLNRLTEVRPPEGFFDNLAHLEKLHLKDWTSQNVILRAPLNCPNLREIKLVGFNLDFSPLSNHQSIESIDGMYFTNFTGIDPNACSRLRHYQVSVH